MKHRREVSIILMVQPVNKRTTHETLCMAYIPSCHVIDTAGHLPLSAYYESAKLLIRITKQWTGNAEQSLKKQIHVPAKTEPTQGILNPELQLGTKDREEVHVVNILHRKPRENVLQGYSLLQRAPIEDLGVKMGEYRLKG